MGSDDVKRRDDPLLHERHIRHRGERGAKVEPRLESAERPGVPLDSAMHQMVQAFEALYPDAASPDPAGPLAENKNPFAEMADDKRPAAEPGDAVQTRQRNVHTERDEAPRRRPAAAYGAERGEGQQTSIEVAMALLHGAGATPATALPPHGSGSHADALQRAREEAPQRPARPPSPATRQVRAPRGPARSTGFARHQTGRATLIASAVIALGIGFGLGYFAGRGGDSVAQRPASDVDVSAARLRLDYELQQK